MRMYARVPYWVILIIIALFGLYLFYYQGKSIDDIIDLIAKRVL